MFVHLRGEVDVESCEDEDESGHPDLEFAEESQAFASLAKDTLRFARSLIRMHHEQQKMPISLAEMLWSPDGNIEGGVVRSPDGDEVMLTWDRVAASAAGDGGVFDALLALREDARKALVETAVRNGGRDGRERTPQEFLNLHRLLRPGDVVQYDGQDAAVKRLVRVGDDVLGKNIRKLTNVVQSKPDPLVLTHMFTCVVEDIAGGGAQSSLMFSLYQPTPRRDGAAASTAATATASPS